MSRFAHLFPLIGGVFLLAFGSRCAQGAAPVPLAPGYIADELMIAPGGQHVVFHSTNAGADLLYSARVDAAGLPVLLSPGTLGAASLFNSQITPDGTRIIYNSSDFPGGKWTISTYSSRLDGASGPVLLNRTPIYDDDPGQYSVAISPDSQHVVIRADQGDYSFDLLSRAADGSGGATALNGPHEGQFGVGVAYDWRSGGNRVVYQLRSAGGNYTLFSREFDSSGPAVKLSPGAEQLTGFAISPDASKVVFSTIPTPGGGMNLYSRSGSGGSITTLLASNASNSYSLDPIVVSQDGQHALISSNNALITIPTDGSGPAKALGPYPRGFEFMPTLSPDGTKVAFMARANPSSGPMDLFISPIDGSSAPRKLNLTLPAGASINSAAFAPDGRHLIFFGDLINPGVMDMFSVMADGSAAPVHLGPGGEFAVTSDGNTVIMGVRSASFFIPELTAIPIDGGEATQLVSSPLSEGIYRWALLPDDSGIVFTSTGEGASEIYSVAIPEPGMLGAGLPAGLLLLSRRGRRGSPC
jgi:hypothetical protein